MPRKLIGGLIQCSNPINDESVPVAKVKQAMLDKHILFRDRRPETYEELVEL